MTNQTVQINKGLEGIIVAETALSKVFGEEGRLIYRGIPIQEFVENGALYEEVVYLLWNGKLPTKAELDAFKADLASKRALPDTVLSQITQFPKTADPMVVLRTVVSMLHMYDENPDDLSPENLRRIGSNLLAKFPTILAAFHRYRQGLEPVAPRTDLTHAANYLYMLNGEEPGPRSVEGVNAYLVLLADHGFNASTFTARVVAGTQADMYGAITGAVASLKGPLHGGAPIALVKQMEEVGDPANAEKYVEEALAAKKRIMGIGHRVYKTYDPRARILKQMAENIAKETGNTRWYELAAAIEAAALPRLEHKRLYTNVDFYSVPLLLSLGLPTDMLTPTFAVSRVAGWVAHLLEQYADNRLMRPRSYYVGPEEAHYVPIDQRS